jgi:hypothetical protein
MQEFHAWGHAATSRCTITWHDAHLAFVLNSNAGFLGTYHACCAFKAPFTS